MANFYWWSIKWSRQNKTEDLDSYNTTLIITMLQAKYTWIKSKMKMKKKPKKNREGNIEATYLCLGYQIINKARTGCSPLRIPPFGRLSNWARTVNLVNENKCVGQIILIFSLCFFAFKSEGNKEPNWKGAITSTRLDLAVRHFISPLVEDTSVITTHFSLCPPLT